MNIVTTVNEWRQLHANLKGQTIGLVPTMGNLHAGHLSLCQRAQKENALTLVSIFVNPKQFNDTQDFATYLRTEKADCELLQSIGVDYVFCPSESEMYPHDDYFQVSENQMSLTMEGAHRPGHFSGMLTIVLKLLNLIQATRAYFGEKDYQQYLLIQKMVEVFFIPTEMISCPTIRAADGLALSSRNSRLSAKDRDFAAHFPRWLMSDSADEVVAHELVRLGFQVDYITTAFNRRFGAVRVGEVRLIDNIALTLTHPA